MADLLPTLRDTSDAEKAEPRVIGVDGEGDDLLDALSSSTTRRVLATLHEEPATPSEVATRIDTSLQNAQYHLEKLSESDLVDVIDTTYSEKGREMDVYAPADRPLVIVAGPEEETTGLKSMLTHLLGGLGVIALLSVLVQWLVADVLDPSPDEPAIAMEADDAAPEPTPAPEPVADPEPGTLETIAATVAGLPPGALFFAGGLVVLLLVFGVWYVRSR